MDLKAWKKKITDVLMPLEDEEIEETGLVGEQVSTVASVPAQERR